MRGPRGALLGAFAVAIALAAAFWLSSAHMRDDAPAPAPTTATRQPPPTPTLYCEFYNFMHNATVVSFLFAVQRAASGEPRFLEMAVVEPDGTRTEYPAGAWVQWTRAAEDGTATIVSPGGATRIVLYGFKPERPGIFWTEAGVRSDDYKNLEGKCRQANFGAT